MPKTPIKLDWLDKALEIHAFHISQCREEPDWTLQKTAAVTNYSLGSIQQYVMIGDWYKTHEKQLKRCRSLRDALMMIKNKQREMKLA